MKLATTHCAYCSGRLSTKSPTTVTTIVDGIERSFCSSVCAGDYRELYRRRVFHELRPTG